MVAWVLACSSMFQFTLPRGERQKVTGPAAEAHYVSIHAPAWGATRRPGIAQGWLEFQFTLPRGERHCPVLPSSSSPVFQFTLPRGERRDDELRGLLLDVSIHAPAWGATTVLPLGEPSGKFQFTLPRGERPSLMGARVRPCPFQFTLPRGERHPRRRRGRRGWGFNSRSRVGSDGMYLPSSSVNCLVSIHAPAWGATRFNSRSRVGSDSVVLLFRLLTHVSIHAPAWGATGMHGK